ncbi:hypothetical protein [Nonomuraea sp. NPDC005692]|uniref:hypothetical protein n=1 Tax=Nonomuraea sp. NPDC005692 TaxID=3157168 RepID=UPI0033DCF1A8
MFTSRGSSRAEDILLPDVEVGDVLAVLDQGAYTEMTSTRFNRLPRPAVVMVEGGSNQLVRRRETLSDLTAREVVPATMWPSAPSLATETKMVEHGRK